MKKTTKEIDKQIVNLYNSGISCKELANNFLLSRVTIQNILHRNNIKLEDKFLHKKNQYFIFEKDICEEYIFHDKSMSKLAIDYNLSISTIKRILINNNISLRTLSEAALIKSINERTLNNLDFFTEPSNELAYMMGFSLADGHCCKNEKESSARFAISIHQDDVVILENFCGWLNIDKNYIKYYDYGSKVARLSFRHPDFLNVLKPWGTVPNKTYYPINFDIDEKYIRPFIIGFIDGDGFVKIKPSEGYYLTLVSNSLIIDNIIKLFKIININMDWYIRQPDNVVWKIISLSNKKSVLEIIDKLNINKYFHLPRKWDQYKNFMENL